MSVEKYTVLVCRYSFTELTADADKVKLFLLAPSTRLDKPTYVKVANALFEDSVAIPEQARSLVFSSLYTSTSRTSSTIQVTPELTSLVKMVHELSASSMLDLKVKEACGIPLLGAIAMSLAVALTNVIPNHTYKAEMEFCCHQGQTENGSETFL